MPTYSHKCTDTECNNEWEDYYSIVKNPPTICPKCGKETAQRLIDGGMGRGIVELGSTEILAKSKEDIRKFRKETYASEKNYANVLGEVKYQNLQTQLDKNKR